MIVTAADSLALARLTIDGTMARLAGKHQGDTSDVFSTSPEDFERAASRLGEFVDAVRDALAEAATGDLPHDFPPWATVYACYLDWRRSGVLADIRAALLNRESERKEMHRVHR